MQCDQCRVKKINSAFSVLMAQEKQNTLKKPPKPKGQV